VEQAVLNFLDKANGSTVESLFASLKTKLPSLTEEELADLVYEMADDDRVELEDVPPATTRVQDYLRLWDRNLWFYGAVSIAIVTVLAVYTLPEALPLVAVRWVLGGVFVLFIPGYVTIEALFPKGRELDGIERLALSLGLSLALVPLIGLVMNYTPWGIRLDPMVASLTLYTLAISIIGVARKLKISRDQYERQQLQK